MAKSTRYFKATDGKITVFRASETRAYVSATVPADPKTGYYYSISFSGKPAGLGSCPCVEITRAEFVALTAAKIERIKAEGGKHADGGSPSDSWVRNSAIEVAA